MLEICAVIPVFDHGATISAVVEAVRRCNLAAIVVDDGSGPDCARVLDQLAQSGKVHLVRHAANRGKGAAVQTGLHSAATLGFTHALQIDADGQHALADIPCLLAEARSHVGAVVCGLPVFGPDAPRSRIYGRRLTNFWVAVNTWSRDIPDAMCGFRVYPLAVTAPLIERSRPGNRMDFDIEILVRLHWLGVPMRWVPTAIAYPPGGASHFRMRLDNALISRAHTILFIGMLARTPVLLARKLGFVRRQRSEA